ncbi:MAG: HAD hydrolase-like protein [Vallitaleaceae bacterium]|jgi:FMN phosphatase YigB (HAD superfamily)|nr:HAD hydrolase-like protein [Vallitaleaceae bacterium]
MYKNIIISYEKGLIDIRKTIDDDHVWEKINLYFRYMGMDSNSFELKKNYEKSLRNLRNAKSSKDPDVDIDIEDVFYKMFKKYHQKAKKKHLKELGILFQVLTTESIEVNKEIMPIIEFAMDKGIQLYAIANGQASEIKNELKAINLAEVITDTYCSSVSGIKKPGGKMLSDLVSNYNLKKKETLVISSDYDLDLVAAKALGLKVALLGDASENEVNCVGDAERIIKFIK